MVDGCVIYYSNAFAYFGLCCLGRCLLSAVNATNVCVFLWYAPHTIQWAHREARTTEHWTVWRANKRFLRPLYTPNKWQEWWVCLWRGVRIFVFGHDKVPTIHTHFNRKCILCECVMCVCFRLHQPVLSMVYAFLFSISQSKNARTHNTTHPDELVNNRMLDDIFSGELYDNKDQPGGGVDVCAPILKWAQTNGCKV